ncbi:MAG TPA: hypothetical protein P5181_00670 [Dermatophilaceae bacterium]|nr:hypothetical protein [Dermatophilaceae bacterium]
MTPPTLAPTPSRDDSIVRQASQVAGGPLGRFAVPLVRGWRWYAAALAAASAVPSVASVLLRGYCIEGGWRSPDQFFHMCFSDLAATFGSQQLGWGLGAFLAGRAEAPTPAHPPLTSMLLAATGGLVPDGSMESRTRFFVVVWAVLGALLLALLTGWTAASSRRMPLRAAHVALSPVAALTLLVAPDILGVALTGAALLAWSRSRPTATGVLLGLAVSARSYPLLVLVVLWALAVRAGRPRAVLPVLAWTLGVAGVVFGIVWLRNPTGAMAGYDSWLGAGAGYGSPWVAPQLVGSAIPSVVVSMLAIAGWGVAVVVATLVALSGPRRPGVAEVLLVAVAIILVTGKSFPVQSSLWLVPLVALAGLRWRDHLLWAAAETLYFGAVWLTIAGLSVPDRGLPTGWYLLFLLLRLLGVGWLAWRVTRQARERVPFEVDPAEPDPLAGPLAGLRDRVVVEVR